MASGGKGNRAGIEIEPLIAQLRDAALGNVELSSVQIRAIEILLRKVLPDLAQVKAADEAKREGEDPLAEFY
jgi:hypothetical protein